MLLLGDVLQAANLVSQNHREDDRDTYLILGFFILIRVFLGDFGLNVWDDLWYRTISGCFKKSDKKQTSACAVFLTDLGWVFFSFILRSAYGWCEQIFNNYVEGSITA
jgi:hypothetical protein